MAVGLVLGLTEVGAHNSTNSTTGGDLLSGKVLFETLGIPMAFCAGAALIAWIYETYCGTDTRAYYDNGIFNKEGGQNRPGGKRPLLDPNTPTSFNQNPKILIEV